MNLSLIFTRDTAMAAPPIPVTRAFHGTRALAQFRCGICARFLHVGGPGRRRRQLSIPACQDFRALRILPWESRPAQGGGSLGNLPGAGGLLGGRPGPYAPKGVPPPSRTRGPARGRRSYRCPSRVRSRSRSRRPPRHSTGPGNPDPDRSGRAPQGLTLDRAIESNARAKPRPSSEILRDPDGAGRHPPGQPPVQSRLLSGRSVPAVQVAAIQPIRPGGPQQFDTNVSYPLDISQKRLARTKVAARAEEVLEAQYQDAVRNRIDDIYMPTSRPSGLVKRSDTPPERRGWKSCHDFDAELHQKGLIPQAELNIVEEQAPDRETRTDARGLGSRPSWTWDR